MTDRELIQQALGELSVVADSNYGRAWVWPETAHATAMSRVKEVITALREHLAQPEQERASIDSGPMVRLYREDEIEALQEQNKTLRDAQVACADRDPIGYSNLCSDAQRLDWLEQVTDIDVACSIVLDWTWDGKRYSQGVRAAIDAALAERPGEKG